MAELEQLQQHIPSGQQVLRQHHRDLQRVAEYCESNYLQASDQRQALEETMALSAQSLASVSFQVSSLASAFLRLLELRAAELRRLEADISCVAQRVEMHKEKVSRREIGSLTVTKRFPSCQTVVPPPSPPCLEPYCRKPLNFSVLDDIGHGVKVSPGLRSGLGLSARSARRRSPRIPEPVRPPVVPEGRGCAASSSLISIRYRWGAKLAPAWPHPAPAAPQLQRGPWSRGSRPPPPPPRSLPGCSWLSPDPSTQGLALPWGWNEPGAAPGPAPVPVRLHGPSLPPLPVVALYPYTQQKDNELSFQPGALLFVTRRHSDGWCEGVMGQEVGFFPGNYVEPL
uniref:ABI gene family member 3 n=1 Tax=Melopsittacus undulatus TaxID=13146 RepID=A0A8V5H076_MELUD